jgi:hypothetical protein
MIHGRTFVTDIFRAWGFESGKDYARTVLGIKAISATITPVALKTVFMVLGFGLSFWAHWVWYPPEVSFLILAMNFINAYYGYQVAKQIKGERFQRIKFQKTFSVTVSDMLAMSMMHIAIRSYPHLENGRHVLFAYLFGFKFTGIFNHWGALKLQEGRFATFLREWLLQVLNSKLGAQVVDAIQDHKPADEAPATNPTPTDEPAAP